MFALGGAALAGAAAGYMHHENNTLVIEGYHMRLGLPKPITVVALADLHGKRFGKYGRDLREKVLALSPDLILFPGDTVSASCGGLSYAARLIGELSQAAPVVIVPGNHERRSGRCGEIAERYKAAGAYVLINEQLDLDICGSPVHILGLAEDIAASRLDYIRQMAGEFDYPDNDSLLLSLSREEGVRIVLTHFPELFAAIGQRSYRRFDFDIMFAGHAHGGQIRLKNGTGLYAPGQGVLPKYSGGMYGERPALVVSRGLGNDSIVPRINNRPEITCVTLV